MNANLPLSRVQTLDGVYRTSLARTSYTLVMVGGGIADGIAACHRRHLRCDRLRGRAATREIGIRVALGARPAEVRRMFLRQGVGLAVVGVVAGLAIAVALTRLMSSLLFGVSAIDAPTYVGAGLGLILIAAAASYLPAHKASAVDPIKALTGQ